MTPGLEFFNLARPGRVLRAASLVLALCALAACGGGGGGGGTTPVTPPAAPVNQAPTPARLVEVSSSAVGTLAVSWLPATDDSTAPTALRYQVHASVDAAFVPSASTLRATTTGATSTTITAGLTRGARYTVKVVALDQQDTASTASQPLDAVVSDTVATVAPGVSAVNLASAQVAAVNAGSVVLPAGTTAPAVGTFIASSEANGGAGFLRRVTGSSGGASGVTVTTSPASVSQVLQQVRVSSTYRLDTVPTEVAQAAAALDRRSMQRQADGSQRQNFSWPETGLSYGTDAAAQVQRRTILAARQPSALGGVVSDGFKSSGGTTVSGKWGQITGQTRVEVNEGKKGQDSWTVDITSNDKPWLSSSKVGICKVEVGAVRYDGDGDGGKPELVTVTAAEFKAVENAEGNRVTRATQSISFEAKAGAGADKPYRVKVTASLDDAGDNCEGSAREQVHIEVLINVTQDTFPTQEAAEETFSGSAGYSIVNRVVTSFSPKLVFDQEIDLGRLKSARIAVSASPMVEQTLTLDATAQGTVDATKTIVKPRTFRKVYVTPAGIPIVISGEFKIDLRIQGSVTGELHATEVLNIGYEEVSFGVEYRDGQFFPVKSATPVYTLKIAGNGKAQADLTLTLLPRLELRAWEALTGVAVLAPALKAEAGVEGHVRLDAAVDFANDAQLVTAADADYRLTKASLFAGLKSHVYADLSIWDERLLVYPNDSAKKDDYTTFKEFELLGWTELMGLPTLSAFMPEGAVHTKDTRLLKIRGAAADVDNPLFTLFPTVLPESFMPWVRWTAAKIVPQLGVPPASYDRQTDPAGDDSVAWVLFTRPGTYTVRLGGHSKLGSWARQYVEIEVAVFDENANGIMDWWEQRYGLTGNSGAAIASADPDGDGASNLQEWLAGTDPTKAEPPPGQLMADPATATVLQSVQFWVTEAIQAVASVVWNFGAGLAEQVAAVSNGISTAVSQAFDSTGLKTVVATFKDAVGAVLGVRSTDISVVPAGPAVLAVSPLQAVAGSPRSFVVSGRALPDGLRFQLVGCEPATEAPGGNATRREFSCTFPLDTAAGNHDGTVALSDSPFEAPPLFTFTVAVGRPSLGPVQPASTTRTLATSFEFTGQDLPTSGITVVPVGDSRSTCQAPNNLRATGFGVACELFKVGAQTLEVRQGTAVLGSVTVNVASNVTGVTWTSPSTSNSGTVLFGETVTYKVAGTNLLADTTMGFAVEKCGVSNTEVGVGSNTERTFTCFFNNEAGAVAGQMPGVVKDAPGGQVLLDGWRVPVEVPPAPALPLPVVNSMREDFNGTAVDSTLWSPAVLQEPYAPDYQVTGGVISFTSGGISSQGKRNFSGARIVVKARMAAQRFGHIGLVELVDTQSGDVISFSERNIYDCIGGLVFASSGRYALGYRSYGCPNPTTARAAGQPSNDWFDYELSVEGDQVNVRRVSIDGSVTDVIAAETMASSIEGRSFYLRLGTPAASYALPMVDWVEVQASGALAYPATGHRYEVITCGTWLQCRDRARALGGHLATVRNQAEQDWIVAKLLPLANSEYGLWIGLTDEVQEGAWRWANGEPVSYTNWGVREPNNTWLDLRTEAYVHMWRGNTSVAPGAWNDSINEHLDGGRGVTQAVVEYPTVLASLPSTGTAADGTRLALGAADPRWRIVSGPDFGAPGIPALASQQHHLYFSTPLAAWLWASANAQAPLGEYVFRLEFDVGDVDPQTLALAGEWSADNHGRIFLNDVVASGTGRLTLPQGDTNNLPRSNPFRINSGFKRGLNTLDLRVTDTGAPGGVLAWNLKLLRNTAAALSAPADIVLPASAFTSGLNVAVNTEPNNICRNGLLYNGPPYRMGTPNAATWMANVAVAGNYRIEVAYAAEDSRPVNFKLDGVARLSDALASTTGSWCVTHLRRESLGVYALTTGSHALTFDRADVFPHFWKIYLTRLQ